MTRRQQLFHASPFAFHFFFVYLQQKNVITKKYEEKFDFFFFFYGLDTDGTSRAGDHRDQALDDGA